MMFEQKFPRAFTPAVTQGVLKQCVEDFIVIEELSFPLSGEGEHAYLRVKKISQNTQWVCSRLAKHFSVKERDIGYAGLKDRYAITTQWFSLPIKIISEASLTAFNEEGIEILEQQRHGGKLRKGAIKYNYFDITLRDVEVELDSLRQRIDLIREYGVPNYFDEQRFGRQRQNLQAVNNMFNGKFRPQRHKQRIYISAARSWLFNLILGQRVEQKNWYTGVKGDVFMLDGSKVSFSEDELDPSLRQRLIDHDIHPTAPLFGAGELASGFDALELEQNILSQWPKWCKKLQQAGLKQQRRAARVVPSDFDFDYIQNTNVLRLTFKLPAGAYATNLVREIIEF